MKRLIARCGKLMTASFFVMAVGIFVFLLSIPLYSYFDIDTDIAGLTVFAVGLAICVIGLIRRNKLHGWKFAVLAILAVVLLLPVLPLVVSLIYFLMTGQPLGN